MIRLRTFALLVIAGLIVTPAGQSSAQVKYVDEAGNTHYAQSEAMVPEQYRAKTKAVGALPSVMMPGAQGGAPYTGSSGSSYSRGSSRIDQEDAQNRQNLQSAAEQNLQQKREDQQKRDSFNRCVGSNRSSNGQSGTQSCF
jgi:hypothetical protein